LIAFITALSKNTVNAQSSSSVEFDELSTTSVKNQGLLNEIADKVFENRLG
jgi:ABC-type tungstate transport system permease subunit